MKFRAIAYSVVFAGTALAQAGHAQAPVAAQRIVTANGRDATPQVHAASDGPSPQDKVHKQQYVLKFTAREMEGGRTVNAREYSVHSYADETGVEEAQIRTSNKVPVPDSGAPGKVTYVDVGINFDCIHIQVSGPNLNLDVRADISSYTVQSTTPQPVIQFRKWGGSVSAPVGKTVTIFSSDDVSSKRTMQIDLTVMRM